MQGDAHEAKAAGQPLRFLLLYALAWAGGAIAYIPFLTLFLPVRVAEISGGQEVEGLGYLTFVGAIAASLGGIVFGLLSDLTRDRRRWIWAGLATSLVLLLAMERIEGLWAMTAALVAWQFALNMMLGPLAALAGDTVPDRQKGFLGGLLACAPAAGAAVGALATHPGIGSATGALLRSGAETGRFAIVALVVLACVLPLLLFGKAQPDPALMRALPEVAGKETPADRAIARMWIARLFVQIAEAALFAYLLYYFRSLDPAIAPVDIARINSVVLTVSIPLALLAGRWADRSGKAIRPLRTSAAIAAGSLLVMAVAPGFVPALAGYIVFGISGGVFFALHTAQTLRVLPRPSRRGRDIGLFNLANTVPSLIMPWLTIAIVPNYGFSSLLWALALLAGAAAFLLATIRALPKSA